MAVDVKRLRAETVCMLKVPRLRAFKLFGDRRFPDHDWRHYAWVGPAPTGETITARYPASYPLAEMDVTVDPDVRTHHKIRGNCLCLFSPNEWTPDLTCVAAIGQAIRFLTEYHRGKTG